MSAVVSVQTQTAKPQAVSNSKHAGLLLQRKCACGSPTSSLTGACPECASMKRLQTKLSIGASNDPLEQEADRVADQLMSAATDPTINSAPPRIQRFTAHSAGENSMAPASVDRVLASSDRPLEPTLRQDMEQRFGHDFSRVKVHAGAAAEQSVRDVNAHAYTVGHSMVFGAGQFAPGTHEGRRLLAHELTHVVQQSGATSATVRRQVDPQQTQGANDPPSLFTIFVADPHKRSDKRFARQQGQADAARIQENGTLSLEDRQLVNAKLRFFEGEAKEVYTRQIKPVLVLATRSEIELPPAYVGKVPNAELAEQARIRRRREHTLRFFAKVKDYQLQDAYVSRLQRYLDEGMDANADWDMEMIEQIIEERAPNARWHASARQDFLAKREVKQRGQARGKRLTTLTPYWQNQFGALAEQTQGWTVDQDWPEYLQVFAQDLLWKWHEQIAKYDDNPYLRDVIQPAVAEKMIFKDIVERYELELRARDRAIQEECRLKPRDSWMNMYGDPCKPWFENSSQRGEQELRHLQRRMKIFEDKDHVPYRDIVFWLKEYKTALMGVPIGSVDGALLARLQSWSTVQGGLSMANKPIKLNPALPRPNLKLPLAVAIPKAAVTVTQLADQGLGPQSVFHAGDLLHLGGQTRPPNRAFHQSARPAKSSTGNAPLKVGDIHSPPASLRLGPQRVTAVLSEVEVLTPVTKRPPANRALPSPTRATSAIDKAPVILRDPPAPAPKPYAPVVKDAPNAPVKPPPALTRDPVQKALPPPDARQLTLEVEQAQQRYDRLREKASQAEKDYAKTLRNTARAMERRGQQLTQQGADLLATKRKLEQARDDALSKLNQAKEKLRVLQPSEGAPKHGQAGLAQEPKYLDELRGRGLRAQLTGKNTPVIDAAIVGTPEVHSVKSIVPSEGLDVAVRLAENGSPRDLADRVSRHITTALMDRRSDKWSRLRNRWNNTMRASHADEFKYELPKNPDDISFVVDVRVVAAKAPSATAQQAVEVAVTAWLKKNERVPPRFTWRIIYFGNQ